MKHFTSIKDVADVQKLIRSALNLKKDQRKYSDLGNGRVLGLIFMNPSLRTRLSTQKAALNLGLDVMVMNFTGEGWALETEEGVIMDGNKAEHIREAAAVVGRYCDIIGIRSFPQLKIREEDYQEKILQSFIKYSGVPVISLESATRHPLQSLADLLTIEEYRNKEKPKVVLTWAPHPKALPQSVANSFTEWVKPMNYEFILTHPEGYELSEEFTSGVNIEYDQEKAFENADFIYVKNWSSFRNYGSIITPDKNWTVTMEKVRNSGKARIMHCLPVRRNVVISDDLLDSDQSIVIQEAENRVYSAQAVLKDILTTL